MSALIRWLAAALTLALMPSLAQAEWREATSEHFVVVSDGSEADLVRMSQRLEAVHWLLTQATRASTTGNRSRVRIYLVANVDDVRRALSPRTNPLAAGFYRPALEGAIAVVPRSGGGGLDPQIVLFHEYAHHFMLQYMPHAYPPWFVEGFAELASTSSFERRGFISYGRPAQHRQAELANENWVPLSAMFARRTAANASSPRPSYGQYWLVTHYLVMAEERRGQLAEFIRRRSAGASDEDAYAAFAGGIEQLNRDARRYLNNRTFSYRLPQLPPEVLRDPVVRVMRPGEGANIGNELQVGRYHDDASRDLFLAQLAQTAAQHPTEVVVALTQVQALIRFERFAEAAQVAERALALAPDNPRALTYRGLTLFLARHAAREAMTPAFIQEARGYIVRGNRAAPDDAVPLVAFYRSFELTGQTIPDLAVTGLYRASRLVPQYSSLRMQVAQELIRRNQRDTALLLLEPLAYAPHESHIQRHALQLVDWLRSGASGPPPAPVTTPESDDD